MTHDTQLKQFITAWLSDYTPYVKIEENLIQNIPNNKYRIYIYGTNPKKQEVNSYLKSYKESWEILLVGDSRDDIDNLFSGLLTGCNEFNRKITKTFTYIPPVEDYAFKSFANDVGFVTFGDGVEQIAKNNGLCQIYDLQLYSDMTLTSANYYTTPISDSFSEDFDVYEEAADYTTLDPDYTHIDGTYLSSVISSSRLQVTNTHIGGAMNGMGWSFGIVNRINYDLRYDLQITEMGDVNLNQIGFAVVDTDSAVQIVFGILYIGGNYNLAYYDGTEVTSLIGAMSDPFENHSYRISCVDGIYSFYFDDVLVHTDTREISSNLGILFFTGSTEAYIEGESNICYLDNVEYSYTKIYNGGSLIYLMYKPIIEDSSLVEEMGESDEHVDDSFNYYYTFTASNLTNREKVFMVFSKSASEYNIDWEYTNDNPYLKLGYTFIYPIGITHLKLSTLSDNYFRLRNKYAKKIQIEMEVFE